MVAIQCVLGCTGNLDSFLVRIITGTLLFDLVGWFDNQKAQMGNIGQYNHAHILNVSMSIFDKLEFMAHNLVAEG